MNLLQHFHNQYPHNEFYLPRKKELIDTPKLNIYGVRGAGKSTLVVDHLLEYPKEEILYIDCEEPNLYFKPLRDLALQNFINESGIKLLILDHYSDSILDRLPNIDKIILVSRERLKIDGFEYIELFPLDYEEFLVFERGVSQSISFNHFLKLGTLPIMAKSIKNSNIVLKTFLQSKFTPQEQSLLIALAHQQTKHLTLHQLYIYAKERFKISKDWLYRTIKSFSSEGIVYFIDDIYLKGGKKIILFDFAFAKYLSIEQPFIVQFDTMVALALLKHHIGFRTLGIHGYLNEYGELIIPAPFESEESIWRKSHNKFSLYRKYGVERVIIITVANQYEYSIESIVFEAMPFYEWSILNEER